MKTSEHLIRAKSLIRTPELWCKNRGKEYTHGPTKRCARQAIIDAHSVPIWENSAMHIMAMHISHNTVFGTLVIFNDYSTTTHEDVMRIFDGAIEAAQKMEAQSLNEESN